MAEQEHGQRQEKVMQVLFTSCYVQNKTQGDAASFLTITFFKQKETFSHSEYQIRRPGGRRSVTKEIQDKPNRA